LEDVEKMEIAFQKKRKIPASECQLVIQIQPDKIVYYFERRPKAPAVPAEAG